MEVFRRSSMLFDAWMMSACGLHTRSWSLENIGCATAVAPEEVVLLVISEVSGLKKYTNNVRPSMLETMECTTRSPSALDGCSDVGGGLNDQPTQRDA
jgi:hypothetical protein